MNERTEARSGGAGRARLATAGLALWVVGAACALPTSKRLSVGTAPGMRASAGGEISGATLLGGPGREEVFLAACDADGSMTLLGDTYASFGDVSELLAVRLGPDAGVEWAKTLGRGNREQLVRARRAGNGFLLLATSTSTILDPLPTMGRPIPLVVKLSANAEVEWSVLVGRTEQRAIYALSDLAVLPDGGTALVGGSVAGPDFTRSEPAVVKLDRAGEPIWGRFLPLGSPGTADAVAALPGGDLLVAGTVEWPDDAGGRRTGIFLLRLDPAGAPRWARRVWVAGYSMVGRHAAAVGDDIVVLGQVGGGGSVDLVALRFSGSGDSRWARRFVDPTARNVTPRALAVDAGGALVVAGSTSAGSERRDPRHPLRGRSGVVIVVGPDGDLRRSTVLGARSGEEVRSAQPLGDGRLCVALTTEVSEGSDIVTALWTPPAEDAASRFQASPLELRVSDAEPRAEPLAYQHAPLPPEALIARSVGPAPRAAE